MGGGGEDEDPSASASGRRRARAADARGRRAGRTRGASRDAIDGDVVASTRADGRVVDAGGGSAPSREGSRGSRDSDATRRAANDPRRALNFFTATTSPVSLFLHLRTTPYAPSPIIA